MADAATTQVDTNAPTDLVTLLQIIKQQYDTQLVINYTEIERDLLAKNEYDVEDVQSVMLQVFQCVLLKAFGIHEVSSADQVADAMSTRVVPLISVLRTALLTHSPPFAAFFRDYSAKQRADVSASSSGCGGLGDAGDDLIFMTLFSYEWFPLMHQCIFQFVASDGGGAEALAVARLRARLE